MSSTENVEMQDDKLNKMIDRKYYEDLCEQIKNQLKWTNNKYQVITGEPGTGKTWISLEAIAEMIKKTDYKVLFVQKFSDDGKALQATVDEINAYAGKEVANYIDGEGNKKGKKTIREILKCRCLVITHSMYYQMALGNHEEFLKGRNILIIDEYPDLMRKVELTKADIGLLWINAKMFSNPTIEEIAYKFRDILYEKEAQATNKDKEKILFCDLSLPFFDTFRKSVKSQLNNIGSMDTTLIEILIKVQQVLQNNCHYYQGAFYTYDNFARFKMLDCNIILDANGSFDARYKKSSIFNVRLQDKFHNYSNCTFTHFNVNTSKEALSEYINFNDDVVRTVCPSVHEKTLFVTDKQNQKKVEKAIKDYLESVGMTLDEVNYIMKHDIKVSYFGVLVGVNDYRDFKNIVIMKTPNYDYMDYVLHYQFLNQDQPLKEDIVLFEHEEIETIRQSMIVGELYQALQRIDRSNTLSGNYIVFSSNDDAIQSTLQQFPNIKFVQREMEVHKRKKEKKVPIDDIRRKEVQAFLLECKNKGICKITQKEINEKLFNIDDGKLSNIMNSVPMIAFYETNNIKHYRGMYTLLEQMCA